MRGNTPHTDDTHEDREALGMQQRAYSVGTVQKILRDQTVFRLVRHEIQSKPKLIQQSDLRALLVNKVAPDFCRMSNDKLILLAQWLGRFGENSHLSPSKTGEPVTLAPGRLLTTEKEFSP